MACQSRLNKLLPVEFDNLLLNRVIVCTKVSHYAHQTTKGNAMKLGLCIDGRKGSAQEPTSYPVYLLSNLPVSIYFS